MPSTPLTLRAPLVAALAAVLAGCTINLGVPENDPHAASSQPPVATARPSSATATKPTTKPTMKPTMNPTAPRSVDPTTAPKKRIRIDAIDTSPDAGLAWIVEGARGEGARCVQHALNVISDARLSSDGYYGPVSRRALEAFQRSIGIRADGAVGPATGHWLATHYDYARGTGSWARTGCYGYVPARRG